MSRYYFDLTNGSGPIRDEDGQDFACRSDLAREVARTLGDIARDDMADMAAGTIALTVRDQTGRTISKVRLTFSSEWLE